MCSRGTGRILQSEFQSFKQCRTARQYLIDAHNMILFIYSGVYYVKQMPGSCHEDQQQHKQQCLRCMICFVPSCRSLSQERSMSSWTDVLTQPHKHKELANYCRLLQEHYHQSYVKGDESDYFINVRIHSETGTHVGADAILFKQIPSHAMALAFRTTL